MSQGSVNVQDLEPEQLLQVKEQLDEELPHLTSSFTQLRSAQAKFTAGMEALDALKPPASSAASKKVSTKAVDNSVLVPLTPSLYVPGRLKDRERVMLDVGTGYYVEQPITHARRTLNQKILGLRTNLDKLQTTIETKEENLNLVRELLQLKVAAQERAKASQLTTK